MHTDRSDVVGSLLRPKSLTQRKPLMKPILLLVTALVLLGVPALVPAGPKEDVAAATQAWVTAYDSRDPARITALYDPEAVFWGTSAKTVSANPGAIAEYFKEAGKRPNARVTLGEQHIRVYGDVAVNTGYYTFSDVRDGENVATAARYTFVYRNRDGKWMIIDHHSSRVPGQ
jgi:uncharacterized protein (TIGR02246 family)